MLVLGGAELALRLRLGPPPAQSAGDAEQEALLNDDALEPFFVPAGDDPAAMVPRRPRALPTRFPRLKPAGEYRVFVLGESSAMRVDLGALYSALRRRGTDAPRVIPAGMGAYDAARTSLVLDEVLGLEADAVVFLLGHNEHPLLPDPSRAGRRLRALTRRLQLLRTASAALPRPSDAALRDRMESRFSRTVARMLLKARQMETKAVVCILPANLRDWPPRGELPLHDEDFMEATLALRGERRAAAEAALRRFASRRPGDPMGRFMLASLLARSDPDAAAEGFASALLLDDPDRTTPARNAALRRLAPQAGAAVADLQAAWAPLSPPAGPGWEVFEDGVHWRRYLGASAAELIAEALRPQGVPPVLPKAPPTPDAEELRTLRLSAAAQAVQAVAGGQPYLSERAVALFRRAAGADPAGLRAFLSSPEAVRERFSENPWAAPLAPAVSGRWSAVLTHAAEAFAREGRHADAARLWSAASDADPSSPLPALLLAFDQAGRGLGAQALSALGRIPEGTREAAVAGMLRHRLTEPGR